MKVFRKILKIFLIVFVLLLGALIAVPFIFKDKIVEMVKTEVNKQINAKVDFGEFSLSIFSSFPNLEFSIQNVSVVGKGDFEGDTLAFLPEMSTVLNLMSVFGDEIKIKEIILNKPDITLLVLKDGKANWDIAISDTTQTEETDTSSTPFKLALKNLELNNADIVYDDKSMDMTCNIENMMFRLEGDLTDDKTELDIKMLVDSFTFGYEGMDYMKKTKVDFTAGIDADLANSVYTFRENSLKLNMVEINFDGNVKMPTDDIGIEIKLSSPQTEFKQLLSLVPAVYMSDFGNLKTSGTFGFNGTINGTYGEKSMPGFDISFNVKNGYLKYPDLPSEVKDINIDTKVTNKDGNEDNTIINVAAFHANMGGNPIDMKLNVTTPVSDPALDGWLKGKIDLATVSAFYPMEGTKMSGSISSDVEFNGRMSQIEQEKYEEFKATGRISCSRVMYDDGAEKVNLDTAWIEVTPQYFDLRTLIAKMGQSDFSMDGKIENFMAYAFRDELLKGKFNFKSNYINLNELMGSEETTTETTPVAEDSSSMTVFEVPKNIDFTLTSSIGKLLYDKIDITSINGEIVIAGGKVSMNNVAMNMLDGKMGMNGYYATTGNDPEVKLDLKIQDFDIKKSFDAFNTVKKIAPMAEKCTGKFGMAISFTTLLSQTMEPVMNTLNGEGNILTKNIVISNISVLEKAGQILKKDQFKTMKLTNSDVKFKIVNGNIEVIPFTSKVDASEITFGGTQSIDAKLNYDLNYKIPTKFLGDQANEIFKNMSATAGMAGVDMKVPEVINVNGKILGTLLNPELKLDLKKQATNVVEDIKDQVTDKINQEVDKAKAEAIKKAQEQADKLYKEAEAKSAQLISAAEKSAQQVKATAKTAADKVRSEGDAAAQKVLNQAKGKGPIAEAAAKKSAEALKSEANKKATDIENKAASEADGLVNKAKQEADSIKKKAKEEGDKLIQQASK